MLGSTASCGGSSVSGSSGIVSRDNGRAALAVLLLVSLLGDFVADVPVVRGVEEVGVRRLVGLAVLVRDEESVEGRLGGAEVVAPPKVVRLVLSALGSVRAVLELVPPRVVERDEGRLFSSPAAVDVASLAGLRVEEVAEGRVGGLLMVLPDARDESVLGRAVEGEVGVRVVVLSREEVVDGFFVSSAFAGGFAPVAVRLSILPLHSSTALVASRSGWFLMCQWID